ncbi:DUF2282 domain-containing protein [Thiolinea disciformis]|uniref:BufA1 family periplasmic bufferin-type metallophore n=1 Tax=Thiolinea disciformis TaxID=125614 RepID=UPI00036376E3|nr:DUF2282 domain-containing protein [Thiolinea disciformis]
MNLQKSIMASTLIALGMAASSMAMAEDKKAEVEMEKCSGIVKAGMNDCGANGHSCAGQAKEDNAKGEWISVPRGTCEKITGGVLVEDKKS